MRSHAFGTNLLPCFAAYALWKVKSDNETDVDVDAVQTILSKIYVNDLCKSCPNEQEAVKLLTQLCRLLASGGFRLTKFFSNEEKMY